MEPLTKLPVIRRKNILSTTNTVESSQRLNPQRAHRCLSALLAKDTLPVKVNSDLYVKTEKDRAKLVRLKAAERAKVVANTVSTLLRVFVGKTVHTELVDSLRNPVIAVKKVVNAVAAADAAN